MRARRPHAEPVTPPVPSPAHAGGAWPAAAVRGPTRAELALVVAGALVATVGAALFMGRDLTWDYLNYHAYSALLSTQDRLSQDFYAAGIQGYFNPLPYLPLGWMQAMGWPAALMACVLAALQSLNLVFLYLIARALLGGPTPQPAVVAAATVLGAATGVFWGQAGSTFVDATLAPLVMASLWLLLRNPGWLGLVGAGLLAGAGPGLKWTLAPYAVALWLAAAALPGTPGVRLRRLAWVGGAAAAGFLLTYGHWGWQLHQAFGSPVFPLFNSLFQAADYPAHSDQFLRYVPDSLAALVALPFRMVLHESWIYTEVPAPDLRPALVVVLGTAGVVLAAARRWQALGRGAQAAPAPGGAVPSREGAVAWRVLATFFTVSLLLWLQTSSNGRYATPTFLLLGPIAWALCERVAGARAGRVLGLLALTLQLAHLAHAGNPRFSPQPWSREMLPIELPPALAEQPLLFVTVGSLSESHLAARVHPQSPFTNPIGMHSLPSQGPGWNRFLWLRDRWAGRTRVVFKVHLDGELVSPGQFTRIDELVDRLGLSLVPGSCQGIRLNAQAGEARRLAACEARLKPQVDEALAAQRELARRITDALQARCPHQFQPPAPEVEGSRGKWTRRYNRHDLFVYVDVEEDVITLRQERQAVAAVLGRVSTWERDVGRFACLLPHGGRRDLRALNAQTF
jgi:hypothetical protein